MKLCRLCRILEFLRELKCPVRVEIAADFDELLERYAGLLLVGASEVDGDCVLGSFLVAYNEDIRILHLLELLDLVSHVDVGVVSFYSYAGLDESFLDLLCICVMLGSDRYYCNLIRVEKCSVMIPMKRSKEPKIALWITMGIF